MSPAAVLDTAYTVLARRADAADEKTRMFGKPEDADARASLDAALGLTGDDDEPAATNVIHLAAWMNRVNSAMGDRP